VLGTITPAGLMPPYMGRPEGRSCAWHYSYTTVNADGGVLPCCTLYRKRADFGEVSETPGSFGRVWNNANFEAVRRNFPDKTAHGSEYPTAECLQCTQPASFRDHYTVLEREIIRAYWSFPDGAAVRQFDEFYMLLQRSPAAFAAAYAARYDAAAASEIVAWCRGFEVRPTTDIALLANFETKTTPGLKSADSDDVGRAFQLMSATHSD
jgi:Iron-sulfur cluster-binding domain